MKTIILWKDISWYEWRYQACTTWEIRSLRDNHKRNIISIVNPKINKEGYCIIYTREWARKRTLKFHRLVAQTFIPNPENKPQINHIDGNKLNNSVDNLEWCTHTENMQHAHRTGLIPHLKWEEHHNFWKRWECLWNRWENNYRSMALNQINLDGTVVRSWSSVSEVMRELWFSKSNINMCCNGIRKTAHGFQWNFI